MTRLMSRERPAKLRSLPLSFVTLSPLILHMLRLALKSSCSVLEAALEMHNKQKLERLHNSLEQSQCDCM